MTSPPFLEDMRREWLTHTRALGVDDTLAREHFEELCTCYSESHRRYHNLDHIHQMLEETRRHAGQIKDPATVFFATWYHDAVYRVPSSKNETRSAQLAAQRLREMGFSTVQIQIVVAMIEATRAHRWSQPQSDTALLLDIDMSILGAPGEVYKRYVTAVEQEHHVIPAFLFNRGRLKFLRSVAAQPHIFLTPVMRDRLEAQAARNIADEIRQRGG